MPSQFKHDPDVVVSIVAELEEEMNTPLLKYRTAGIAENDDKNAAIRVFVSEEAPTKLVARLLKYADQELEMVRDTEAKSVHYRGPFGDGLMVSLLLNNDSTND